MLDCADNPITILPETLPDMLRVLLVDNCRLSSLPNRLPSSLETLYCNRNKLTCFPDVMPDGLIRMKTDFNSMPVQRLYESIREFIARVNALDARDSKERTTQRCSQIWEELMMTVWHPSRVEKLMLMGVDMEDM